MSKRDELEAIKEALGMGNQYALAGIGEQDDRITAAEAIVDAILSKPEELPTREQLLKQIAVHMDTIRTQSDQLSKPEEPRGDGLAESTREDWWPCPSCGQKMRPDLGYLSETLGMTCTECGNRIIITRKAWIAFPPTALTSPARTEGLRMKYPVELQIAEMQEALIQARGALRIDAMVDDEGNYFGTTMVALEAINAALAAHPPQQGETP
jgi:DNA-directed RNA polymerase subunit RPC12/RpoP